MLFGIYSCNGPGSEDVNPDEFDRNYVFNNSCNDINCSLLTDHTEKSWEMVSLSSIVSGDIPKYYWENKDKSEILTFCCNKNFFVSYSSTEDYLFSWSISKSSENSTLYFEPISAKETISKWANKNIQIQYLTVDMLVIELNGMVREYAPYYLSDSSTGQK